MITETQMEKGGEKSTSMVKEVLEKQAMISKSKFDLKMSNVVLIYSMII